MGVAGATGLTVAFELDEAFSNASCLIDSLVSWSRIPGSALLMVSIWVAKVATVCFLGFAFSFSPGVMPPGAFLLGVEG